MWYHTISGKLPTAEFLHKIKIIDSSQCRLCLTETNTLDHFIASCSKKQPIWTEILQYYYPDTSISNEQLRKALSSLSHSATLRRSQQSNFLTIIATTHWIIWCRFWAFVIDQQPFIPANIISTVKLQVSVLLPKLQVR